MLKVMDARSCKPAKKNGLNPSAYLLYILKATLGLSGERNESLLWWNVPEDCQNTK